MMRAASIALCLALAGGPALAAGAPCMAIEKAKAKIIDSAGAGEFIKVTPGAFHFLQGFYVANPATPSGLPPGDGALLFRKGDSGMIIWTRGKLACAPLMVPAEMGKLMKLLAGIRSGALDEDGQEL